MSSQKIRTMFGRTAAAVAALQGQRAPKSSATQRIAGQTGMLRYSRVHLEGGMERNLSVTVRSVARQTLGLPRTFQPRHSAPLYLDRLNEFPTRYSYAYKRLSLSCPANAARLPQNHRYRGGRGRRRRNSAGLRDSPAGKARSPHWQWL